MLAIVLTMMLNRMMIMVLAMVPDIVMVTVVHQKALIVRMMVLRL